MTDELKRFFKSINYEYDEEIFSFSSVEKVLYDENKDSYDVFINCKKVLPIEIVRDLLKACEYGINGEKDTKITLKYDEITNYDTFTYYRVLFGEMLDKRPSLRGITVDDLTVTDDSIVIEVATKIEHNEIEKENKNILKILKTFGIDKLNTVVSVNEELKAEIKKDIEKTKEMNMTKKEKKVDPVIMGHSIKKNVITIGSLTEEKKDVTLECFVFGHEMVEREKISFITLKISDKTDSILAKIKMFGKSKDECPSINKRINDGDWYRINGDLAYDDFAKDFVLTIYNLESIPSKEQAVQDLEEEKRCELHVHTMMSQMDGVSRVDLGKHSIDIVPKAFSYGHKAIAITDHNGCQAFPIAFEAAKKINKKIENEEDKFKVLYGVELVMTDETVNIVYNEKELNLDDAVFVVFDTETTGFNAGIADSMIEIGAVKIQYGEIIDRFDELIDPKELITDKITEVTNIENYMLQGKDDEETVVKRFKEWIGDLPLVAHNAKFDISFIASSYYKHNLGDFNNSVIDTLELSRALDPDSSKHSLSALVKKYNIPFDEEHHHRADYDAEGTGYIFTKMLMELKKRNITNLIELNKMIPKDEIFKHSRTHHINLIALNKDGLKNMFKLISFANTDYLYKTPRIPRNIVEKYRQGLLISSSCYQSEVFNESLTIRDDSKLEEIIKFYDMVEVQCPSVLAHLVWSNDVKSEEELEKNIKRIIELTKKQNKIIVATGDVHQTNKEDTIYREIVVNQKVPGGGLHPLSKALRKFGKIPDQHLMTTREMLDAFSFLDEETKKEVVIYNPNKVADMADFIEVIPDTGGIPFSPKIENSVETVKDLVYTKAHELYGSELPEIINTRIEQELSGIIKGGFDVIYLIAQKLVKKSNDDGYIVGSRGSVGSSLVATFMGISEVNPLPAHYRCPNCKHSIFEIDGKMLGATYSSGYDLPDMVCPECGSNMLKDGQDMPFATFLGFDADKVPDIDLNFSGDYQWKAHEYTKELFGVDNVYRAGTIGTVADKTAYGYVQGFFEDRGIINKRSVEIERLAVGCTGVKRTTGQHPGGIVVVPGYMEVFDFTPFQFPAEDNSSLWRTTHFDYHAIDQCLLKLDILGHDDPTTLRMLYDYSQLDLSKIPMDDKDTMSIFSSPEILGVTSEEIMCDTGTLGIPEFGTKFVIGMLKEAKPTTFSELIKISGLSHGTDVWLGNAQELINNKIVPFKEVIGCRDDIMVYLMNHGMEPKKSFKIMEFVRKGKASKDPEGWKEFEKEMREGNIADWYIDSCKKIKYMFPKAHAAAYVTSAYKIAWFKVHHPIWYYSAYFSVRINDFDVETMIKGKDAIKNKLIELQNKGKDLTNKEVNIIDTLRVALEMTCRGFKFKPIHLEKSDAKIFTLSEDGKSIYMPFRALDGLGESVALKIIEEKEKGEFISVEDFQTRCKVNGTQIEKLKALKVLDGLPESSQLSLF